MKGLFGLQVRAAIRIFIFIFSIINIGLFASDVASLQPPEKRTNNIFALVVGVLSTLTCAYHCLATVSNGAWYIWDFVLSLLWAALAGTFGSELFSDSFSEDGEVPVRGTRRGKLTAAVAFALCCMILYLSVTIHGCAWCCASRSARKRETAPKESVDLEELGTRGA